MLGNCSHLLRKLERRKTNETLVVFKTGSTELETKLSVHLKTTLRCYPNRLIFSDAATTFQGETVIDALESVSPAIKGQDPDFALYRRLQDDGEQSFTSIDTHGPAHDSVDESWTGHPENPGWKLDKWKFLPMVNRTLHEYPSMKWYVFVEADTYILWSSLLQYIASLDHRKPYYSGVKVFIGDIGFAHGGSGFIVSQPAMRMVVEHYAKHKEDFENFTAGHWAGDCVLGKAFNEAGVDLKDAWPIFQGDHPGMVSYFGPDGRPQPPTDTRIWCSSTASYHHLKPDMVEDFWRFEQQQPPAPQSGPLQHRDIFKAYALAQMNQSRLGWDNESANDVGLATDFDTCRAWCEADAGCLQYSLDAVGHCKHFHLPRLGRYAPGVQSGWLAERIKDRMSELPPCDRVG